VVKDQKQSALNAAAAGTVMLCICNYLVSHWFYNGFEFVATTTVRVHSLTNCTELVMHIPAWSLCSSSSSLG
jgi:hypothetical protein